MCLASLLLLLLCCLFLSRFSTKAFLICKTPTKEEPDKLEFYGFSNQDAVVSINRPLEGTTVPRYILSQMKEANKPDIGSGAYGVCSKVMHRFLGQVVYKKINKCHNGTEVHAAIRQREFDHCYRLNHHPNIVTLCGYVYKDEKSLEKPIGYLLEYMAGGNLFDFILKKEWLHSEVQKTKKFIHLNTFAKQIAVGLAFMHDLGIMHRDLKPNNILVSRDGYIAKIADFGLSKDVDNSLNDHTKKIGNWRYRAPEVNKGTYNYPVDVYSYGMTLYFMYYKENPFEKCNWSEIMAERNITSGKRPILTGKDIDVIIKSCWDTDPDKRCKMSNVVNIFYLAGGMITYPVYDV